MSPIPDLDLTPIAFLVTGLACGWSLYRFRLLDIVPVARHALVESMSDAVIVLDSNNRIVDANPSALRLIGHAVSDVIGQPAAQVLVRQPELVAQYRDVMQAQAEIVLGEGDMQRWYDLRITPLCSRHGRLTGRVIVLRDVTDPRQTQAELRALLASMDDVILVLGRDGRYLKIAPTNPGLLYKPAADLLGKRLSDVFPQPQADQFLRYIRRALGNRETVHAEYGLQVGEQEKWFDASISPLHEDAVVFVARDITARKQAEEKLTTYRDHLEDMVAARTAQLVAANAQLEREVSERQRIEVALRQSLQEKEVLLKEIHHRVKNNLQVVASLLSLQAESITDEFAARLFQDSQNRVRSMALIHEHLYQSDDLARVHFGEYARALTAYLLQMYQTDACGVRLNVETQSVTFDLDTAIPCGLIINELVSNALKHAFPDGRRGEIEVRFGADGDGRHILAVRDDGVGFPEDLDWQHAGSLGLQLVNTLARQLNGTLELGREGGTVFQIKFASSLSTSGQESDDVRCDTSHCRG